MSGNEFLLIEKYFSDLGVSRPDTVLSVGDDAALLTVPQGQQLVVSIDTLLAGVHFPHDTPPAAIAWKAVAVSLSDLAAMGAEPAWLTLALTLPDADEQWCGEFAQGLAEICNQYAVQLVGGDTTRGSLSVTIQAHGFVPDGYALRRDAAKPGDKIFVTDNLGDAGLALLDINQPLPLTADQRDELRVQLDRPVPRVTQGLALRNIAHAAIDVSDGLLADLGHILERSGCGAVIRLADVPVSRLFMQVFEKVDERLQTQMRMLPLSAGDDYELCFTVSPEMLKIHGSVFERLGCYCIGEITEGIDLRCVDLQGEVVDVRYGGYQHF